MRKYFELTILKKEKTLKHLLKGLPTNQPKKLIMM